MRALFKLGGGMFVLGLLLIGAGFSTLRANGVAAPVNWEGRSVVAEERPLGKGILSVELHGPIDMHLRQGATPSLTVRAEKRLQSNIMVTQDGSVLTISTRGMLLRHREPLVVDLVLPTLEHLNLHGSGDSDVNGFSGDKLDARMHGAGKVVFNGRYREIRAGMTGTGDMDINGGNSEKVNVELNGSGRMTVVGQCKEFKAAQKGSGDLDAEHLSAETANVSLQGSGSSNIRARRAADVTLKGTGDVLVYGAPTDRNVSRSGTGEVIWK